MGGKDSVLNRTSNHLLLKYYLMSAFNPLSSSPSRARKAEGGIRRMKQLENYIAVLESRNPSLSSLVQMKVEEECAVFEEKSEQILSILREKDEKIASLQVELELSADHPHLERVVEDTAREMEKWKEEAKTERREHQKTICALSSLQEEFERLRVHYNALLGENIALREKELDQTQHIQILLASAKVDEDGHCLSSPEFHAPTQQLTVSPNEEHHREVQELQKELQQSKDSILQMQSSSTNPSLPTPSLGSNTANLLAMVELYKEQLTTSEEVASVLRDQLDEMLYNHEATTSHSRSRLSVLEEKVEKKEAAIALLESDKKTLSEELRALQAEYAVLKVSAENSAVLLDAAEKESQTSKANKWWLKLWEEMGKMEKKSLSSLSLSSFPEANVEAQVVEIVRLKQEIIDKEYSWKRRQEKYLQDLTDSQSDLIRLKSSSQSPKSAEQHRIEELTDVVKALRSKNDLCAKYAEAKQHLAIAEIASRQREAELNSFRDMLALEKNKSLALRRELDELTIVAQHRKLQDSVQFVPGVSAVAVIEICAGRITRLEHELGLAKAQLQLQPRNREVRMAKQRAADGLASLADGLFSEHNKGGMQLTYSPSCSEPQLRHILFETQLLTHRARVSELEEEVSQLLAREFELPPEVEIDRAELSNCRKQLELFKVELKCKNDEIVLLKKSLSLMHSKVQEQTFDRQMERPSRRNHQLVSIVRDPPSSDREDELRLQLRQCNCEIRTLRETIAALQTDSIFNEENKSDASRLEFDVLPSLRKKLLEFSLELSHGKSLRLLAEHQAHICLRQVGARDQEVRGLREQIKTLEEEVVEHRLLSAGLTERLKEAARLEADSRRIAEEEKEDLLSALRQLELERCSQEILVRQLNEQLKQQQRPQTPHSTACPVNDDDFDAEVLTVDDDILSIIQVVKNVSDLEDPHRKRLIEHLLKASTRNIDEKKIEFARKSFEQRLARVIALLRSEERKVRALSECIANQEACVSAKMSIISHHGIRSIMRRQQHDKEMVEMYLSECERSAAAEMKIETTSALVGKLRLRVIELEEFRSGGSSAECREGATDCMFDYIRHVEEDMKQWRESELPMLLTSHLNIENISQICFTNGTLSTKVDAERCAQLASALAVTKTQLSAALMRCSYLTEEVTSLKNRNLLLQSNTEEVSERVEEDDSSTGRDRKQFPSSSGDKEAQFLRFACHHVPELESRVDALEEEIVDFQETALVAELRAKVAEHALLAIQEEGRKLEENHLRAVSELRLQHEIRVSKLKRGLMKNEHEGERADDSYQLPAPILQPLSPQFFGDSTQSVSGKKDQLTAQAQREGYFHGAEIHWTSGSITSADFCKSASVAFGEVLQLVEQVLSSTEPSNTNAMLLRSARKLCRQMMDTVTAILSAEPHSAYTQRNGDDSGSVVEWESRNSSALSSIRKQMREVEKVILVKDDMEEQFQLLTRQKTQLLEHSQRTSSLLRDAQSERSEMERLLATLKSSFEASLSSALEELESQRLASRAQIRRLENLLVKQQSQLSLLGLGYKPNLKIKERSEMPFRSKQGYSAYENRMRAYREELDSGSNCMEVNDNRTSVDYSSQLEDEILNLRVYLEAETAIRAAGENELRVLQDKLSKLEKKSPEPDNRSAVQLIKDTEARGIEDQNEIFMTADFKDNLIAELNTLRRQQKDELIQMGYKLNALEATALNTSSEENQRQRETVMLLRTQLVSSKEEVARKDDAISAYKKKKVALGKEVENLQRSLSQAESKLSKLSSVEVSKSIAMKELKRKYEEAVVSATDKELFSPTAAELLRRLEVADLEKSRMTGMLSSCKVKLSAALDEIEELHLEVDRLQSIERNLERIQASNVRKDATSKANKEAMEKTLKASDELRKHFDVFRVEADKEKKSLQRRNELVNARLKQKDELLSTALEKITCLERQQMDCMAERENFIKEQKQSSAVYVPQKTNTSLVKVVKTVKLDASHVPVELRSSLADLNDVLTALGDGGSFVEAPTVPTDQSLGPF